MVGVRENPSVPIARAARGEETVTLRGTNRGFELIVADGVDIDALIGSVREQLERSPAFFAGNDVIVQFVGHPIQGALGPLEEVAAEFDLTIVAVRSVLEGRKDDEKAALSVVEDLLEPAALGTEPVVQPKEIVAKPEPATETDEDAAGDDDPTLELEVELGDAAPDDAPAPAAEVAESRVDAEAFEAVRALALQKKDAAKIIVGPVRSGCILEATEHLIILGDVNPGAEVTSLGSIAVLGRMRGIAHAGASGNAAFIFAIDLEPQQLRLGTKVARAGDGDGGCARGAEIAYTENDRVIVEPYAGRLPFSLARTMS